MERRGSMNSIACAATSRQATLRMTLGLVWLDCEYRTVLGWAPTDVPFGRRVVAPIQCSKRSWHFRSKQLSGDQHEACTRRHALTITYSCNARVGHLHGRRRGRDRADDRTRRGEGLGVRLRLAFRQRRAVHHPVRGVWKCAAAGLYLDLRDRDWRDG